MALRCRRKPLEVEAMQFSDQDSAYLIQSWIGSTRCVLMMETGRDFIYSINFDNYTSERLCAGWGSWIVKGDDGHFSVYSQYQFEKQFEVLK
jgi:hypothetical protein